MEKNKEEGNSERSIRPCFRCQFPSVIHHLIRRRSFNPPSLRFPTTLLSLPSIAASRLPSLPSCLSSSPSPPSLPAPPMKLPSLMVPLPRDPPLIHKHRSKPTLLSSASPVEHVYGDVMISFQDLMDTRTKYEGFLTHGQIVSAAAFDFARSLQDMASYMIETFGDLFHGEIGHAFGLLARVQIEVSELLDLFASHVSQTVVRPMESMMTELQEAQVVKEKYSQTRKSCNRLLSNKQEHRFRKGKTSKKTETVKDDMRRSEADYVNNHVQSLFQSQSQSLLTLLAKYHGAQLHLFGRGHLSVAGVESAMKELVEDMHIDSTLQLGSNKSKPEEDRFGNETFPCQSSAEVLDFERRSKGHKSEPQDEIFATYVLPSPSDAEPTAHVPGDQPGYYVGNTFKAYSPEHIQKSSKVLREQWPLAYSSEINEEDDSDSFLEPKSVNYRHSAPFPVKPSADCGYSGAKSGPLRSTVSSSRAAMHALSASSPMSTPLQISELHKLPLPPAMSPPAVYPIQLQHSALLSRNLPQSNPFPLPQPPHFVV